MYTNPKKLTSGYRPVSQTPIDDRIIKVDIADLINLGTGNARAYEYYEGMQVFVLEENAYYKWVEDNSGTGPIGGFTYPANIISASIDYSNRTFDFVKINFSSSSIIEGTYAELAVIKAAGGLIPDATYKITDKADRGIYIKAATTSEFHVEATGLFLNCDFQSAGDYSGVTGYDITQGVWYLAGEGTYSNGQVVFYNNEHYVIIDDASFTGVDPSNNAVAYSLLDKTNPLALTFGYILEADYITYNFSGDTILSRHDKRRNIICNGVNWFQFGNDLVIHNTVSTSGAILNINQRGLCAGNQALCGGLYLDENHEGQVSSCIFHRNQIDGNLNNAIFVVGCTFELMENMTLDPSVSYTTKTIRPGYSNFDATLNMGTAFAAGDLTIPTNNKYIGIFNLSGSSGSNISKILNLPTKHKVRFRSIAGQTQNFVHTAVAGLVAEQLVSNVVGTVTVTGNTDDFIEYEYSADTNGVKAGKKVADSIAA